MSGKLTDAELYEVLDRMLQAEFDDTHSHTVTQIPVSFKPYDKGLGMLVNSWKDREQHYHIHKQAEFCELAFKYQKEVVMNYINNPDLCDEDHVKCIEFMGGKEKCIEYIKNAATAEDLDCFLQVPIVPGGMPSSVSFTRVDVMDVMSKDSLSAFFGYKVVGRNSMLSYAFEALKEDILELYKEKNKSIIYIFEALQDMLPWKWRENWSQRVLE